MKPIPLPLAELKSALTGLSKTCSRRSCSTTNEHHENHHSACCCSHERQQCAGRRELALDQIDTTKAALRAAKDGLNTLSDKLKQVQRDQKIE